MTTDTATTYNGWRNYETWNVKLWLDNEESSYRYWREATRETIEAIIDPPRGFTKTEWATIQLSNRLKDEITDNTPDLGASMWADLLGAALSEVDWYEIAQNLIEDAD